MEPKIQARLAKLERVDAKSKLVDATRVRTDRVPATWTIKDAGAWQPPAVTPDLGEDFAQFSYRDDDAFLKSALRNWNILGATQRGRLHAHRGTHREDAYCSEANEEFAALCVCDGAGAYRYSRVGAEITVRRICRHLQRWAVQSGPALINVDDASRKQALGTAMAEAVRAAISRVSEVAAASSAAVKDFRCTLLLAFAYHDLLLTSKVGDGFIAALGLDGQVRCLGPSQKGPYAGEVTCFLPDPEALSFSDQVCVVDLSQTEAVMLGTDGLEDAYFPLEINARALFDQLLVGLEAPLPGFERQPVAGPILSDARSKEKLAAWLAFEKRGENDDRTVMILFRNRRQPSAAVQESLLDP